MLHAVVIVTHNSAEDIGPCLRSVRAHSPASTRIIVVDSASSDSSLINASLAAEPPGGNYDAACYTADRMEGNDGYAAAANRGAALASLDHQFMPAADLPDAITFLNPDTIVSPGWLDRMAAHLTDESVAAVGPLSNFVGNPPQKYQMWLPPNDKRASGGFEEAAALLSEANAGRSLDVKLLIGFALMVPRRAWEEVGPFDERCALGMEDLEWSLRARRAGKRLVVAPDTLIYHRGQRSFRSMAQPEKVRRERESKDALRSILREWYPDRVPTSDELWGVPWFETRGAV